MLNVVTSELLRKGAPCGISDACFVILGAIVNTPYVCSFPLMGKFVCGLIVPQATKRGADNGGNFGNEDAPDSPPFRHRRDHGEMIYLIRR